MEQLYAQAERTDSTSKVDKQVFRKRLNNTTIDEALVSLIVVRNLPFRLVEWPEFHTFCRVLNPESYDILNIAHSMIGIKIKDAYFAHKDTIRKRLQSALSCIHISLDIWTSPNRILLLGVVADFVDRITEQHTKALLGLRPVSGHSGDIQFEVLLPILQDYGIVRSLGAVMGDNASTNDTLCRTIEDYLLEEENIVWDAD